jgi:hypothetical protein
MKNIGGIIKMNTWYWLGGAFLAYQGYNFVKDFLAKKADYAAQNKPTNVLTVFKDTVTDNFVPEERFPSDLNELSGRSLGGQPTFYNLADHRKGRFLGWTRYDIDKASERVVHNNLYRLRIAVDVKFWWFIVGNKEIITPCVFRPNIDSKFIAPGSEEGVPPEGVLMLYRSITGTRLVKSNSERFKQQLLDSHHKIKIMSDMIANLNDKERIQGAREGSKLLVDEIESRIKQSKRMTGGGSSPSPDLYGGLGNPYGGENFGDENLPAAEPNPQNDQSWEFKE